MTANGFWGAEMHLSVVRRLGGPRQKTTENLMMQQRSHCDPTFGISKGQFFHVLRNHDDVMCRGYSTQVK